MVSHWYSRIRFTRRLHFYYHKEILFMTDDEKRLLQAKHRMEEAQARDRVKERKARTRRLIQEGAILEKAFPVAAGMELETLEYYLVQHLQKHV